MRAAGPDVYITSWTSCTNRAGVWMVRPTSVCSYDLIRICFVVMDSTSTAWNNRLWAQCLCFVTGSVFSQMQGYARVRSKTPLLPVSARSNVRTDKQRFIKCWRVRQPCSGSGAIAGPTPSVADRVLVISTEFTAVSKDCRVIVLCDRARVVSGLPAITAGFLAVGFGLGCIWCFCVLLVSDSRSICAGLTQSAVTVSTLPFCMILNTQPLLDTTCFELKWKVSFCDVSGWGHNQRCDMATRNLSE